MTRSSSSLHLVGLALGALLWSACDEERPTAPARPPTPPAVEHDFGVIPHGKTAVFDYVIDTSIYDERFVPLRVQLDCSCGRGQLVLRDSDGNERQVFGNPLPENAQKPGETLIARIFIDTLTKDPIDLPKAISRGFVVLQPIDDIDGRRRIHWPILIRFGIDCPVKVTPLPAIDFGKVPLSAPASYELWLEGDENHPGVRFGPATCGDPSIEIEFEQIGDRARLIARCEPGEVGSGRALLRVATDLPDDYSVNLSVTWKAVPDLEVYPMAKLSFRTALDREQTEEEARHQYLQLASHDPARSAEFELRRIVGSDGSDASKHFAVSFTPIAGRPRHRRVFVRYLGGLSSEFRGRLVVAPVGDRDSELSIALVVFPVTP